MFKFVWHLITGAFTGDFQDAMNDAQGVFDSLIAFISGAFGVVGDAVKYVFGDAGTFIVDIFEQSIENVKNLFNALRKLVTGDFQGHGMMLLRHLPTAWRYSESHLMSL